MCDELIGRYCRDIAGALRYSLLAALPLLTLPKATALVRDFAASRMVDLPKRTAKFQFLFGVLLTVGVLLPAPSLTDVAGWIAQAFA